MANNDTTRAAAARALDAYQDALGDNCVEEDVADLIADLLHYVDSCNLPRITGDSIGVTGLLNYRTEVEEAAEGITCPRCGGEWGYDDTCGYCTDDDGNARPHP